MYTPLRKEVPVLLRVWEECCAKRCPFSLGLGDNVAQRGARSPMKEGTMLRREVPILPKKRGKDDAQSGACSPVLRVNDDAQSGARSPRSLG